MGYFECDGDSLRGIGLVALHASYCEEEIDNLLASLESVEPHTEKVHKWPTSRKISHATEIVTRLGKAELKVVEQHLGVLGPLFERRNEILHGRFMYADENSDMLYSARLGVAPRRITPEKIYDLANELHMAWQYLFNLHTFNVPEALGFKKRPN